MSFDSDAVARGGVDLVCAAQRLKYSTDTVGAIAREAGYTSEYAFNRAFALHRGQPSGRYRRLARVA